MKSIYTQLTLIIGVLLLTASCTIKNQKVVQGKLIDPTFLTQVKKGMSTEQVRIVLGSPAIMDVFTPNKWVYYYSKTNLAKNQPKELGKLVLIFNNKTLTQIIGGENLASEKSTDHLRKNTIITEPTQKKRGIFN